MSYPVLEPIVHSDHGKVNVPLYEVVAGYAVLDIPKGVGPFYAEMNDKYAFDYLDANLAYYAIDLSSPDENETIEALGVSVTPIPEGLVGFQMTPVQGIPRTTWTERDNLDNAEVYRSYRIKIENRPTGGDLREIILHRRGKLFSPIEGSSGLEGMGRFEHGDPRRTGYGTGRPLHLFLRDADSQPIEQSFEEYVIARNEIPIST